MADARAIIYKGLSYMYLDDPFPDREAQRELELRDGAEVSG